MAVPWAWLSVVAGSREFPPPEAYHASRRSVPFRRHLPRWGVSRLARAGLVIIFCLPFEAMWSYFAWMNQTLAMVTLWMITAYLNKRGRNRWVGLLPALVMTYVCMSYVFISPLMCGMRDRAAAYLLGGALTLAILITMIFKMRRDAKSIS
uniref:hypothetical protein n=1 Tax=Alistipes onderdonkii TaxID=328813 RepID=UPI004024AE40